MKQMKDLGMKGPTIAKQYKAAAKRKAELAQQYRRKADQARDGADKLGEMAKILGQRSQDIGSIGNNAGAGGGIPGMAYRNPFESDSKGWQFDRDEKDQIGSLPVAAAAPSLGVSDLSKKPADRREQHAYRDPVDANKADNVESSVEGDVLGKVLDDVDRMVENRKLIAAAAERFGSEGLSKLLKERPDLIASLSKDEVDLLANSQSEAQLLAALDNISGKAAPQSPGDADSVQREGLAGLLASEKQQQGDKAGMELAEMQKQLDAAERSGSQARRGDQASGQAAGRPSFNRSPASVPGAATAAGGSSSLMGENINESLFERVQRVHQKRFPDKVSARGGQSAPDVIRLSSR